MRHFCTYFDTNYITRGLALYQSLEEHCCDFFLWVLCLDEDTYSCLSNLALPSVGLIRLCELEDHDRELAEAKKRRRLIEYYFTCTPALPLYVLLKYGHVDRITYLDADLYFFSSPDPLFEEMANSSIAIIAHRFSPALRKHEDTGIYNVSWVSFRRDSNAFDCLDSWRNQCIENCHYEDGGKVFGDQRYLDDWPTRFNGVHVIHNEAANLAYWNILNYNLSVDENIPHVNQNPLIFFHFQGLIMISKSWYDSGFHRKVTLSPLVINHIFKPYIIKNKRVHDKYLKEKYSQFSMGSIRKQRFLTFRQLPDNLLRMLMILYRGLLLGKYIYVPVHICQIT